jgi:L-ascorbate metabolism protein UlaG (beta-lactamase superfamily)
VTGAQVRSDAALPLRVTYLGHATLLLEMDGVRIMTDPVLRGWVGPLRRRGARVHPAWIEGLDAVLISHTHMDHLDLGSLALLPRHVRLLLPHEAARVVRRLGFQHVQENSPGDTVTVGPLHLTATYARHVSTRLPFSTTAECLGFLVEGSRRVYFAGDTGIFAEMADLSDRLDLALLPVWGWGPRLGLHHMNPLQAAQALQLLRPRVAVPIHWGTLHPLGIGWTRPRFLKTPPREFAAHAALLAPEVDVRVLNPGEVTRI